MTARFNVDELANSAGTGPASAPYGITSLGPIYGIESGADADTTLTVSNARIQKIIPTATRNYTLPTTSILAGDVWEIYNDRVHSGTSLFNIVVKSSNGNTIATLFPGMRCRVMSLQATPTTSAHWDQQLPLMSEWLAFTPTGSWSNTTYTGVLRRVGDVLEFRPHLAVTSAPSGALTVTIPLSLTLDTAKVTADGSTSLGAAIGTTFVGGNYTWVRPRYSSTTIISVGYLNASGAAGSDLDVTATAPASYGAGNLVDLPISIPISGWSLTKG